MNINHDFIGMPLPLHKFFEALPVHSFEVGEKQRECDRIYYKLTEDVLAELVRYAGIDPPYNEIVNPIFLAVLSSICALNRTEDFCQRSYHSLDLARENAIAGRVKESFLFILEARFWTHLGIVVDAQEDLPIV
jgi:hypothetical protein